MLKSSACAKFILAGEHSVVQKGFALVFPLTKHQLQVEFNPHQSSSQKNELYIGDKKATEDQAQQFFNIIEALKITLPSMGGFRVSSNIPIGSGLGSSAALCVALLKCFENLDVSDLAERAHLGENLVHGKSSGADPFCVSHETAMAFQSSDKSFRQLDCQSFRRENLCFLLINTGIRHDTKALQENVSRIKEANISDWENRINKLAKIAELSMNSFEKSPSCELSLLMEEAQRELRSLGASHERIETIIELLKKEGLRGAKLTGAGGGGFVLAQCPQERSNEMIAKLKPFDAFSYTP